MTEKSTVKKTTATKKVEEPKEENKVGKIINCPAVNLRSEPSLESFIKTTIRAGENVKVVKKVKNFYFVKFNSYEGYIVEDYVDIKG